MALSLSVFALFDIFMHLTIASVALVYCLHLGIRKRKNPNFIFALRHFKIALLFRKFFFSEVSWGLIKPDPIKLLPYSPWLDIHFACAVLLSGCPDIFKYPHLVGKKTIEHSTKSFLNIERSLPFDISQSMSSY